MLYGKPATELESEAQNLAAQFPCHVCLRGRQPVATIYQEIDVLINPSTSFDPLPTTLLEAARAGIPAVASSYGGASEIIRHRETGYVFDPSRPEEGSAYVRLLASAPKVRKRMGEAARRRYLEAFQVETMVREYRRFWVGKG